MGAHIVYVKIINAINSGTLMEPFTIAEFIGACPGLGRGTYRAFLYKHRMGNPGNKSELVELVSPGHFKLIRPIKYGIRRPI